VEKRVVLDDIPTADRKSDRLLATLPPRSPTIQRDEDNIAAASKLHASKSEYNILRPKTSQLTRAASSQPVRARLATSISVSNSLSTRSGHVAVDGQTTQTDVVGSWKVHDLNEVREPKNSLYGTGRATLTVGRVNSASQQTRIGGYSMTTGRTRTDHGQRKHVDAVPDSTQCGSRGTRPRSVPPKLSHQTLQVHDAQCGGDSMGAQYEPGNVRHLVQTFQSAFRPATTPNHGDPTVDQVSAVGPDDELHQGRDCLQTADRQYHRPSTGGETVQGQRWPSNQRGMCGIPPRTDTNVNVCVVRPATGRSLPQPPSTTDQQQSPVTQEPLNPLEPSDTRSTNKVTKLWQAYGCL